LFAKEICAEYIFADKCQTLIPKSRFTFCKDEIFIYMQNKVTNLYGWKSGKFIFANDQYFCGYGRIPQEQKKVPRKFLLRKQSFPVELM